MTQPAASESPFRVVLPGGSTIERLPIGRAHDAWHLVHIGRAASPSTSRELHERLW